MEEARVVMRRLLQRVQRSLRARQSRLNGIGLIVNRRSGTGEIVDFVKSGKVVREWQRDVVIDQTETFRSQELLDIRLAAGVEVVDADNIMTLRRERFAKIRAEKTCPARDRDHFYRCGLMRAGSPITMEPYVIHQR